MDMMCLRRRGHAIGKGTAAAIPGGHGVRWDPHVCRGLFSFLVTWGSQPGTSRNRRHAPPDHLCAGCGLGELSLLCGMICWVMIICIWCGAGCSAVSGCCVVL